MIGRVCNPHNKSIELCEGIMGAGLLVAISDAQLCVALRDDGLSSVEPHDWQQGSQVSHSQHHGPARQRPRPGCCIEP